jgi:hypothetical protein
VNRIFATLVFGSAVSIWGCGSQPSAPEKAAAPPPPADPPKTNAPAPQPPRQPECPAGEKYPPLASPAQAGRAVGKWKGDLNGDGREDMVIQDRGDCSNWGDCLHAVFLTCDSRQIPLWSGYANEIHVTDSQGPWKEISIRERTGGTRNDRMKDIRLIFDGTRYVKAP